MALTFLPDGLVIESDASITDVVSFHLALREWEDSEEAAVFPVTHIWKALDLGGGASFNQVDLVNGWRLRFAPAGSYVVTGNLNGAILPVPGVYVERRTSAAYVTTAVGATGPTAAELAAAVQLALSADLARLERLHKLHGLDPASPLVVDDGAGTRRAGGIAQLVETSSDGLITKVTTL